ncbi:hypothetical protein GO495_16540 [Chitinophaga oryziterrae]|uniref:Uncharacterized protein n=1 Tax=Chitinophaga oryziterrae TaxID=1031224 RepID=A0A6N8JCE2_9BACT|nr:hypothetical protein [Chitinophaga oryziterrae]MVT42201.1 hypothetical protein [Chitinophaga oryziterrae]
MKKYKKITMFFIEFALTLVVFIAFFGIMDPPLSVERIGTCIFISLLLTFTFSFFFKRKQKTEDNM